MFLADGRVVSDSDAISLREYLDSLLALARVAGAPKPSGVASKRFVNTAQGSAALVAEHPWLLHHVGELRSWSARQKSAETSELGLEEGAPQGDEEVETDEATLVANDVFA